MNGQHSSVTGQFNIDPVPISDE